MTTDAHVTLYGPGPATGGFAAALVGERPTHVKILEARLDSTDPVADVAFAMANLTRGVTDGSFIEPQIIELPDSTSAMLIHGGQVTVNGNISGGGKGLSVEDWPRPEEEETPPSQDGTPGDYHDEGTLTRFVEALREIHFGEHEANEIITHALNRGFLIRERGPAEEADNAEAEGTDADKDRF